MKLLKSFITVIYPVKASFVIIFFFFTKTLQLKLLYSWHDDHFKSIKYLWNVRGKGQSLSLHEGALHSYTLIRIE